MEKSRLIQARTLALRRNDRAEVENIDVQLRELAGRAAVHNGQTGPEDEPDDILAKVNERNRKANMEAVRKAELLEAERKRKERKLARSGAGTPVPADPSARLRTVPRMYASRFVIAYSRSFRNAHGFSFVRTKTCAGQAHLMQTERLPLVPEQPLRALCLLYLPLLYRAA